MRRILASTFVAVCLVGANTGTAWAWGIRGHKLISDLTIQVLQDHYGPEMNEPFAKNTRLISNYATVPDDVWKSAPFRIKYIANQCHYFSLDLLMPDANWQKVPRTVDAAVDQQRAYCRQGARKMACRLANGERDKVKTQGHAPWRVQQFGERMVAALRSLPRSQGAPYTRYEVRELNEAILFAGLQSHFLSDLANPMHTSADYDGYGQGQGGLHVYFEDSVVQALLRQGLAAKVLARIKATSPARTLVATIPAEHRGSSGWALAVAMALDSHKKLLELYALDRRHALIEESFREHGRQVPALRREPYKVANEFEELLIDRLAIAADLQALAWYQAWEEAGKPDLRGLAGKLEYKHQPSLDPDYLDERHL